MKNKKENSVMFDALKAVRKQQREEEIAKYGKRINYCNVEKSKKQYTRKEKHKKDAKLFV